MKVQMYSRSRKTMLLLAALFFVFNLSYGQVSGVKSKAEKQKFSWKVVTGKVTDENGNPLKWVIITIPYQSLGLGTITNDDGNFEIVLPENLSLSFNYIGYKTVTIKPDYDKEMIVTLRTEIMRIEPIEIYPPDYCENRKSLSSIINGRKDIGQTETNTYRATTAKQNETIDVQFVEKKITHNLNNALIVKNDTICPDLKVEDIDPESIWSIRLLDKANAIKKYGAPAENGVIAISTEMEMYYIVEEMPEFPGGIENLKKVLKTNIIYPEIALKKGMKGAVYVRFVVDARGFVTNAEIEKGVSPLLDNEALQAVRNLPKWKPGKQRGMPVKVTYEQPVIYRIPADYQSGSTMKLKVK